MLREFSKLNLEVFQIIESNLLFSLRVEKQRKWMVYLSARIKLRSFLKKDVEEYLKRYEALLSSKTCDIIVYTFL